MTWRVFGKRKKSHQNFLTKTEAEEGAQVLGGRIQLFSDGSNQTFKSLRDGNKGFHRNSTAQFQLRFEEVDILGK